MPGAAAGPSGGPGAGTIDFGPAGSIGPEAIGIAALAAASTGGVVFVVLARRRRRADPLAAAAVGSETGAAGAERSDAGVGLLVPPLDEAHIPRWRRPSLKAERFGAGHVTGARRPPLVFPGPPDETADRQVLRYDQVTLAEEPDEALGRVLGHLRAGDQVDVLERGPIWALVRTPTGQVGWLQAMTLVPFDAVTEEPEPEPPAPAVAHPVDQPEDAPSLESLLDTIIAERRARELAAAELAAKSAAAEETTPPEPRPRSRRTPRSRARPSTT